MNLFNKKALRNLGLSLLSAAALSACGGAGSCTNCSTPLTGDVTLKLTAPNQYPAGVAVTAYLTMTNTSQYNASNLYYAVPSETNYTGTTITVANGVGNNPCVNIAAGASCTFPAQIAAGSHPGSFTVTATPNGNSPQSSSILNSLKSTLGLQSSTLSLTANIGLTTVPANTNSGANGITFLYSSTIPASESGDTLLSVVGVVNSATAGAFNTINLTDASGTKLNFSVLSGNSGKDYTNLANGSVVSFLLKIPSGVSSYQFYAQTVENDTVVDQGTTANPITIGSTTAGILVVQPTNFVLSTGNNYESQIITLSNIGNGNITGLTIPTPVSPLEIVDGSNTCGSTLAPVNTAGSSCSYTVISKAGIGVSGQGNMSVTSTAGGSAITNYTYAGTDPVAGISITSGSNPTFNFVSNTVTTATSSQITLTNTGNTSENNFVFTVPTNFALTAGTTGTPCAVNNKTVSTVLANKNDSCTLTLTYTNGTVTSQSTADLLVDYKYGSNTSAPQSNVGLTYSTVQATAVLEVIDPTSLPYTFNSIVANNVESQTRVFTVKNTGTGPASNIANGGLQGPAGSIFTVIPSTPTSEQCGSGKSTLAVGETCLMTVRFGPIAQQSGFESKTFSLNYLQYPTATPTSSLGIQVQGTLIAPLAANIEISDIALNPAASGGNGSQTTPFAIASSVTPTAVTLTYKNTGAYVASEFTVDTDSLTGYDVTTNNCTNVSLAINSTCTVVLSLLPSTVGGNDLLLSNLMMSWKDQRSPNDPITGVPSSWVNGSNTQSTAYINVYAPPSVTAVLSSESDGTPTTTTVNVDNNFYVVFTLTGGYNVGNMTYTVGTLPLEFTFVNGDTCQVSSNSPTCFVKITAPNGTSTGNTITVSGTPIPSPTSLSIDVLPLPTLSSVSPQNLVTNALSSSGVSVTFNEAMESTTLIAANIKLQKVSDSSYVNLVSPLVSVDKKTVTFATEAALASGAEYKVIIPTSANIKNISGVELNLPTNNYPSGVISTFTVNTYSSCSAKGGYILNQANNSMTSCYINSDGGLSDCAGVDTSIAGLDNPIAGTANNNYSYAAYYIANSGDNSVGTYGFGSSFNSLSGSSNVSSPKGIASYNGNPVYIANDNGTLTKCGTGSYPYLLSGCAVVSPTPTSFPTSPSGLGVVGFNNGNVFYYTANTVNNKIMVCNDPSNLGSISSCSDAVGSNFDHPVAFNGSMYAQYLIIVNSDNTLTRCDINGSTGGLSNCARTGSNFNNPSSIYEYNGKAYVTNKADNTVTICNDSSGALSECNRVQFGFSSPVGFTAFDPCS